ncbi:MAG: twin-arginine translocase TatA/TatE family subunit [Eggerthellaceae bacterium]|nr:twin-arginine translocase TatA/TatE family subunit [Eggerthellaceae bacterium]
MKIFGMGGFELVIILVVILLIFGPKNLPKLGNAIGKTVSNLRSGMNEGKKKKDGEAADEASADEAPADGQAETAVAEIEGEVETVKADPDPDPDPDPAAPATDAAEPKRVKRVVRKKVATGESTEAE